MRCQNCGAIDFIKVGEQFECAFCGQKWREKKILLPPPKKEEKKEESKKDALYALLKSYIKAPRINENKVRELAQKILWEDFSDSVGGCILAYLDRGDYPDNYKMSISRLEGITKETGEWLIPFLIESSEYKYLNAISELLLKKGWYKDYSLLIRNTKNRLEEENENYSSIARDVFVCYSSNDLERVSEAVERLESDGSSCWYARRNMPRNSLLKTEYKKRIEDAISKCKVFLVIASSSSMMSEDVQWELDVADKYGIKNRIEYLIEDVENTTRFKRFFDGIQWIDAREEKEYYVLLSRAYDMMHKEERINDIEGEKGLASQEASEPVVSTSDEKELTLIIEDDDGTINVLKNSPCTEVRLLSNDLKGNEMYALALFRAGKSDEAFKVLDALDSYVFENLTYYYIGTCFEYGYGTEINLDQAEYFYRLAENSGKRGSDENIGECYYLLAIRHLGSGVFKRDEKRAFELFKKASRLGNIKSKYNLGICYRTAMGTKKNLEKSKECFLASCKELRADSYYQLGLVYDELNKGDETDKKAVEYYKASAEAGNTGAMTNLGIHYYYGNGATKSYDEAVKWYQMAADAGNTAAQYNLGRCYFKGNGVPRDMEKSRKWFEKSAQGGNKRAAHYIIDNFN